MMSDDTRNNPNSGTCQQIGSMRSSKFFSIFHHFSDFIKEVQLQDVPFFVAPGDVFKKTSVHLKW